MLHGHDQQLFDLFALRSVHVEREVTARPELQFNIMDNKYDVFDPLRNMAQWPEMQDRERTIAFIKDIALCNCVMEWFQKDHPQFPVTIYHSKLPEEDGQANIIKWRTTHKFLMIASSGFGAGINYKHVRRVFLIGSPRDDEVAKSFQEAGRAGSDLQPATIYFVSKPNEESNGRTFAKKLYDPTRCIPGCYAELLDGLRLTCSDMGCLPCTHCESKAQYAAAEAEIMEPGGYEFQITPNCSVAPSVGVGNGSSTPATPAF